MPPSGVEWRFVLPVQAEGLHRQEEDASQGPRGPVSAPGDLQIPAKRNESGNAWCHHIAIGLKSAIFPQTRRVPGSSSNSLHL